MTPNDTKNRIGKRPSSKDISDSVLLCYGYGPAQTDEERARQLGISRRTLSRWKKRPDFREHFDYVTKQVQAENVKRIIGEHLAKGEACG